MTSIWLLDKECEFLAKLADLCEEYNAGISYSWRDDGIHIAVDGKVVFVGWLHNQPWTKIRADIS